MTKAISRWRNDDGFTIVELAVAMTVFAVLIAALAASLSATLNLTRNNRNRTISANLASAELDSVRSTKFSELPIGQVVSTKSLDGVTYTITRDSLWVAAGAQTGPCDGSSGSEPSVLRVTVLVSWPNMTGVKPVTTQTLLSPPISAFDPNSGHVGVKILDRDGEAAAGHVVTLTGTGPAQTQTTTTSGCAFFAFLPAGNYTVSLSTTNHVDGQLRPPPPVAESVTVTPASLQTVQFDYDEKATLLLTLTGDGGGVAPLNVPVSIANTSLLPVGRKAFAGTASPRTIGNLYPYLDGYQVFAGDCNDADPEAQKPWPSAGDVYPGAVRKLAIPTTPGGTTSGVVFMGTVEAVVKKSGVSQVGLTVVAKHCVLDDGACTGTDAHCSSGSNLTMGITGAGGKISAALPWGLWEFTVNGKSPSGGAWPTFTNDPRTLPPRSVAVNIL